MKGKNKKIKKPAKKVSRRKVNSVKPAIKRKAVKKKVESVLGSSLPFQELGTRVFVRQEKIDEPVATSDLAQAPVAELQIDSLFPEFDFSTEELDAEDDSAEFEPELNSNNNEMSDKIKVVVMYVAVTSIMAVIVFFWVLSVKYSLGQNMQNSEDPLASENMEKLNSSLGGLKDDFFAVSDFAKIQIDQTIKAGLQAEPIEVKPQIPEEITNQLKEKLQNLNTNSSNTNTANINN